MKRLLPLVLLSMYSVASAQDQTGKGMKIPEALTATLFTDTAITPSPACLAASAEGEVFIGVDLNGSLGKGPDKGRIIRALDTTGDGIADRHTVFAEIDNPRGLIPIGAQLFVLHTVISKSSGQLEAMHLSVLEDKDRDGKADGPGKILVHDISPPKHNQSRGADHTTNGIHMGIDGWVYIAVGDFGIHGARGTDGTELTMLGGGIVRVRPDGSELEVYTHGLRNIYDVAIDPRMNLYTRGNTNDGGGWNVRFAHQVQSGEYGYPMLFKHFTDEILPALADLGGGSGTGALYLSEPGWPEQFTDVPMMCDWGRSQLVIHRVTPDGPSFTQAQEDFITCHQVTDVDVDGSGRLYLSAWNGAGFKGSPDKGYTVRVTPKDWTYRAFPDVAKASSEELLTLITSSSAKARHRAQRELITRTDEEAYPALLRIAADRDNSLDARVAALFTAKQWKGEASVSDLVHLTSDASIREFALRALADRLPQNSPVPIEPFLRGLNDTNPRVRVAAAVGLGRLGRPEAAPALLAAASTPLPANDTAHAAPISKEGPHAAPNPALVVPHVAVQALRRLKVTADLVRALSGPDKYAALWALKYGHETAAVEGLIRQHRASPDPQFRAKALETLLRLSAKEKPYDGSWWWGTRPDTHGPYYKTEDWEGSGQIRQYVSQVWQASDEVERLRVAGEMIRQRIEIDGIDLSMASTQPDKKEATVDLSKVDKSLGEVGRMSIEDVMAALEQVPGDTNTGKALFTKQGCMACHTLTAEESLKGPYMGHVGSILSREQIAESILNPNASISQGFATVMVVKINGEAVIGFVSSENTEELEIRDITGKTTRIKTGDIKERKELEMSMMPPGLVNPLSVKEFASLVQFLSERKQ